MLIQFQNYLTSENIYLWTNFGIIPFWLLILFIPNSRFTQIFVNSVIIPLIISSAYIYLIYQTVLLDEPIFDTLRLYLSLDNLYTVFATENFLLVFWLHFVSLNLFLGSWVSRDGIKYNMSRKLLFIPLILIYFMGPVGLVLYWIIRVFYAKKLGFHD
tara:strand:+ start:1038 stop:1511 length:474 start_codon:yes stop_codon:yes gene_type:complete